METHSTDVVHSCIRLTRSSPLAALSLRSPTFSTADLRRAHTPLARTTSASLPGKVKPRLGRMKSIRDSPCFIARPTHLELPLSDDESPLGTIAEDTRFYEDSDDDLVKRFVTYCHLFYLPLSSFPLSSPLSFIILLFSLTVMPHSKNLPESVIFFYLILSNFNIRPK
ncbi:unnamed protein product [Strongylus vulgaris]|uniref:Uncharacterized protein n=1 Tax=Strongylus vulgaris TaxID=40348 RepID=A0A3P7JDJ0_STRVU|nr:unnamed protein product [Strongylus vulgaris]